MRVRAAVMAATTILGAIALATAPAVGAAENPYATTQATVQYTVYQPMQTLGLAMNPGTGGFQTTACSTPGGPMINAAYGSQQSGKSGIGIGESQKGCLDGPDGVGRYGTVAIGSATATIMGQCPGQRATCPKASVGGVRHQAYTTVTLPAAHGHTSTLIELYTNGIGPRDIARILRGLAPVAAS